MAVHVLLSEFRRPESEERLVLCDLRVGVEDAKALLNNKCCNLSGFTKTGLHDKNGG
jgi:hypothetical protein